MNDLEKTQDTFSKLHQAVCIISNPSMNSNWGYNPENAKFRSKFAFFVPCDLEALTDDLEKQ